MQELRLDIQDGVAVITLDRAPVNAITLAHYQAIGEFLQDFNPDNRANSRDPEPLIKRNPLLVWHGICFIQAIIIVLLLWAYLS